MGIFSKLFHREQPAPVTEIVHLTAPVQDAPKAAAAETSKTNYKVAGLKYRPEAVLSLARENPDWALTKAQMIRKRMDSVPRYCFDIQRTELVPEPDNPHDPNAIKVVMDGVHIGYIKAGNCVKILNLMQEGKIVSLTGRIYGGPWKGFPNFAGDLDDPDSLEELKGEDLEVFPDEEFSAKVTLVKRN